MLLENMTKRFSHYLKFLGFIKCLICGFPSNYLEILCASCQKELPILPKYCSKCGNFFHDQSISLSVCGKCVSAPPLIDQLFILFPYTFPIPELLIKLKFGQQLCYARLFSELFKEKIKTWYEKIDRPNILLPVPLHRHRLQQRGFNQALEIAKPLAKFYNIKLDFRGIERIKNTHAQTHLSASKRQLNLHNAFLAKTSYKNKRVVILDDVMTTGTTVFSLAKVLKNNGAERIDVWCCARRSK